MLVFAILASLGAAAAQDGGEKRRAPLPLFSSDDTLKIELRAPWRRLTGDKENQEPYPAVLKYTDGSSREHTLRLTIARRGISRQKICRFPPIMLRFEKQEVTGTLFNGAKSIKMVTHCDNRSRWQAYPVLEMLAYRMYNQVTELSFRVRPLSIAYLDSEKGTVEGPHFAFLIEDDRAVARRNGLRKSDRLHTLPESFEPLAGSRFALFQYLIGNVDWSALAGPDDTGCCHNTKLLAAPFGAPLYPLPYDFDMSGLVAAHYAAPAEALPIKAVTQRLYRGFCVHNPALETARREFLDLERQVFGVLESEERLAPSRQAKARRYLEKFYEVVRDPVAFEKKITRQCRK